MADKTTDSRTMDRSEFANYLRRLADEFDGEGSIDVPVGNKNVQLRPRSEVKKEIEIVERTSILRGDREAIGLDVRWRAED
jgi:amphi-Trp domain-containing protein